MTPRTVVQALKGPRAKDAGVVESVSKEKDANGVPHYVSVRWDTDGELEEHAGDELKVLLAH